MLKRWVFGACIAASLSGSALGQVTWDTAGNGNWEDTVNWSIGALPQPTDDVTIDQGGGFTITIDDSVPAVQSLMSVENIAFGDGRDLTIQNGGSVSGSLTLGVNSDLTINGGAFSATGTTTLDGGNVFANGGSAVDLSSVAAYLTDTGTNNGRQFTANGASTIDLSGMTDVTGGGFIRRLEFNANGGSSIDLSALTNYVGGTTQLTADGSGSSIDISALASMTDTESGVASHLKVSDGGTINANSLAAIGATQGNRNRIIIDGAGSTLNASLLTTVNNTQLQLTNGGTHDFSGITNFDGSDALADSGVTFDLTGVTTYDVNGGGNQSRQVTSNGLGTTVDLSNLTSVTGGSFIRSWNVAAENEGTVDLSGLTNYVGGTSRFTADGTGSSIDISAVADITNDNGGAFGHLKVSNGGTINANALTSIGAAQGNLNRIIIDGAGSTLNASLLTTATNTQLQLTNGGTHDFSDITSFDGSSALADSGVTLDLTGVTTYDVNGGGNQSRTVESDGAGTTVDLSNLTTVTGGTFIRSWNVTAENEGTVDLSGLTDYVGGTSRFTADGTGSSIDISAVADITNDNNDAFGHLKVSNGGTINANALTTYGSNRGNAARIIVDGAGSTLNASLLTDAVNTQIQLTNGGTHDFSGITSFDGGDALADSGVTLDLSSVTSYDTNGGGNQSRQFTSEGAGTVVDLSGVTSVIGGSFIRDLNVNATTGGKVDLSGVADISGGAVNMVADGAGSQIDFSSLQSFNDSNNDRTSTVEATNGGQIQFGANDLVLTNVALGVNSGGMIVANSIELIRDGLTDSSAEDDAMLFGDSGTVVADVFNTSGIVSPGNSAGTLTIDGDYTQGTDGLMTLEIFDESTFDTLFVLGDVVLDGDLSVLIDDGFDLGEDMDFLVLDVSGSSTGSFAGLTQGTVVTSDNGFDLRVDYMGGDGNDVVLTTSLVAVPEPSSMIVIGAALFAMTVRRKRSK